MAGSAEAVGRQFNDLVRSTKEFAQGSERLRGTTSEVMQAAGWVNSNYPTGGGNQSVAVGKGITGTRTGGIIGRNIGNKKLGWAYNRALAFLFFHSEPVTSDHVTADLASGYNDGTYEDGGANLRLGEFGGALRERLGHMPSK